MPCGPRYLSDGSRDPSANRDYSSIPVSETAFTISPGVEPSQEKLIRYHARLTSQGYLSKAGQRHTLPDFDRLEQCYRWQSEAQVNRLGKLTAETDDTDTEYHQNDSCRRIPAVPEDNHYYDGDYAQYPAGGDHLETLDGKHHAEGYPNTTHDAPWCQCCNLLDQTGETEYQPDDTGAESCGIDKRGTPLFSSCNYRQYLLGLNRHG